MRVRSAVDPGKPLRIGVFGSSFNPPTLGHVVLLAEARWRLGLDRIIVVPTGQAWHKDSEGVPSAELRLKLAEAAFGDQDGVEISDTEVIREGPSYTCDTLEEIHSANPDSQILLVAGSDAALGIGNWNRPERVLELAGFAVAQRFEFSRDAVERAFAELGHDDRVDFFEMPRVEISSTLVRERKTAGLPWRHLVPPGVPEIVENEDLYG